MQCIVIFGIQGSGKGTQAKLLSEKLGYQHVNIGDLLRDQVARGTELGNVVQSVIARGALVDDDLIFRLIDSSLDKTARGIVFDGFPRTQIQLRHLEEHYTVRKAFYLCLDESEALARIGSRRVCGKCGENYNLLSKLPVKEGICDICAGDLIIREDDRPEAIHKRIVEFQKQTKGLTRHFEKEGTLSRIPAEKSMEEVFELMIKELGQPEPEC